MISDYFIIIIIIIITYYNAYVASMFLYTIYITRYTNIHTALIYII